MSYLRIFVSSHLCIFASTHQNGHNVTVIPPLYVVSLYLRIFASSEKKTCMSPMHLRILVSTNENGNTVTVIPPRYVVSSYLRIFTSKWSHGDSHSSQVCRIFVSSYLRIFASSEKKTCMSPMHLRIFVSWYLHIKMVTW